MIQTVFDRIENNRGVTLLEMVVASGILATILAVSLLATRNDVGIVRNQMELAASAQIDDALSDLLLRRLNSYYFAALHPASRCMRSETNFADGVFATEVPGGLSFGPDIKLLSSVPGSRKEKFSSITFDVAHNPANTALARCTSKTFGSGGATNFSASRGLTFCFSVRGRPGVVYRSNDFLSHRPIIVEGAYYVDDLRQTDRPTCNELATRWYLGMAINPNRPPVNTHLFYTVYWQSVGVVGNPTAISPHSRTVSLTRGYR